MELKTETRELENGREVILATEGGRRHWAILRWVTDSNVLSGYVGVGAADGLDDVRPIRITSRLLNAGSVLDTARVGFIGGARLRVAVAPEQPTRNLQAELASWDAFLAGRGEARERSAERLSQDDGVLDFAREESERLIRAGLLRRVGGHAIPDGKVQIATALPISGLRAAQMQAAVAGRVSEVPRPPRFNVKTAKEALAAVNNPSSRAVIWYGSGDPEKSRIRLQAAKSYPLLAGLIADSPYLARAVDAMEPIQDGLIERTGLGKGALKRISKLQHAATIAANPFNAAVDEGEDALGVNRHRRFAVSGSTSLDFALARLSDLPPDRVPQDDRSWQIYNDILSGCAIPLANAFDLPIDKILGASKGDWVSFHATLARAADVAPGEFDRRRITLATLDVIQAVEELSRTAILPLVIQSISEENHDVPEVAPEYVGTSLAAGAKIVFGASKNIAATAFEHARRYASRIPALLAAASGEIEAPNAERVRQEYGPENFPHLVKDDFVASNGLVIRPFKSYAQMIEESRRLEHCVGHYYLQSALSGTPLLSVQSADGTESFSTIELRAKRSRDRDEVLASVRNVQHRGLNNSTPSEECREACDEFMAQLMAGELATDIDELEDWADSLRQARGAEPAIATQRPRQVTWKSALGMDWENDDRRAAAWEEWRYVLGGRYGRAEHPGVLWSEKTCRDLLASMSPETAITLAERARQPQQPAEEAAAEPTL